MAAKGQVPSVHSILQTCSTSVHHEIDVLKSFALETAGGVDRLETLVENAAKQAHDGTESLEKASVIAADHVTRLEKIATNRGAGDESDNLRAIREAERIKAQELRIADLEAASLKHNKTIRALEKEVEIRDARIRDIKKQHARILELEATRHPWEGRNKELKRQQERITHLQYRVTTKEQELSRALEVLKKASSKQQTNKRVHTKIGYLKGSLKKASIKPVELGMTAKLEKVSKSASTDKVTFTHEYKRKLAGLPPTPKFARKE
ncbi:hypothetical protein BLS_009402 [Venturia inaequalis]|uniref:Uncharacterized protein n=1 Tax=Venturia inaequalis TaxID=5025 RepID=A0A8H3V3V4_VENIN|nr:hypothetical protein EG328_000743 [Venturia inaequalis]KAE9979849.1 hypothetical protein BLS_009402 [Venturia inaequalis]KAE9989385.1 hypothetical protein EG327_002732 [Venturia inaequalis]RDI81196.1 hypothetical protein Vi05172_g8828 [Venturia inaequalis]